MTHLAKHHVLAVQPRREHGGDEELAAVRVRPPGVRGSSQVTRILVLAAATYALAIDRSPGTLCFSAKFSSSNLLP